MYGNDPARSSMTETSLLPSALRPAWYTPVSGRISSQALVAENVPAAGQRTVYVATSKGVVYALGENGYIRWRVELGQLDRICQQIDGYGVTGTGVIDPATRSLYLADAFGRLHALDLVTGAERAGWPVQLFTDHRKELVWGALTLVNGSIYGGTGAYCDRPMIGTIFRVDIATRAVSRWQVVPPSRGGGGGVWGWGGVSYSAGRGSLFVATGNAFEGGSNTGKRFREWAKYGEHIVELSPTLTVRSSHHPRSIDAAQDLDFVGSPVVFPHPSCGELVAVLNKDGYLYAWRSERVSAGTVFKVELSNPRRAAPLLTQLAFSPLTGALYASTPTSLVRVDVTNRCRGRVTWGRKVGNGLFNGSPTIAGDIVWLAENGNRGTSLLGFDARSGARRYRARLAGPTYTAPTVVGDRLYVGTYIGGVQGFALSSGLERPVGAGESPLPEHRSFAGPLGWASREDGVYATENGGATWRPLYPRSAIRVTRVSALTGMISVGDRALGCACRQRRLWTPDGGVSWRPTSEAVGNGFIGSAGTLWWWRGGALFRATHWPPGPAGLRGSRVARLPGVIVDAKAVPGGVVALVSHRVAGLGFDRRPRLLFVQRRRKPKVLRLPWAAGEVVARSVDVAWPTMTVRAHDGVAFTRREEGAIEWRSIDGGAKWVVSRR